MRRLLYQIIINLTQYQFRLDVVDCFPWRRLLPISRQELR
jgi:hypothetical protein